MGGAIFWLLRLVAPCCARQRLVAWTSRPSHHEEHATTRGRVHHVNRVSHDAEVSNAIAWPAHFFGCCTGLHPVAFRESHIGKPSLLITGRAARLCADSLAEPHWLHQKREKKFILL